MTDALISRTASRRSRPAVLAQAGLSLLAAAVFAFRGVRTALGEGMPGGEPSGAGVVLVTMAALLAVGAAALAFRSTRAAAVPLGVLLLAELALLDRYVAPPRLVTALPLVFAMALGLVQPGARADRSGSTPAARRVVGVLSLLMLAPVGFMYLMSGLVVPGLWLFGMYALFTVVVVVTVWLVRRGSWWALATPPLAAALWYAILYAGGEFLGWTA